MIREMTYERIRNLGNYETCRLSMTEVLNDADIPQEVFKRLVCQVEASLGIDTQRQLHILKMRKEKR